MNRTTRRLIYSICVLLSAAGIIAVAHSGFVPLKYILLSVGLVLLPNVLLIFLYEKRTRGRFAWIVSFLLVALIVLYSCLMLSVGFDSQKLISQVTSDSSIKKTTIDTTKPFNLYISGIDTYGDISTVSRSDVNILATINPSTHHILLTTIPRDSYVKIAGGGNDQYDKLTHAGIYGVDSSRTTVARLLNMPIDNYVRINFTSFVKIVDTLGGVDVTNPTAFTTDSKQVFPAGTLHLNGKDALTFSRERHNLAGGDNDRGRNQERVISAIIQKISSPTGLYHYRDILGVLGSSIQTNLAQGSMTALVNKQLDGGSSWTVEMADIAGKGQTGGLPSYAMPTSQLYMFVLNNQSLQQAQSRIQAMLR